MIITPKSTKKTHKCLPSPSHNPKKKFCSICAIFITTETPPKTYIRSKKMQTLSKHSHHPPQTYLTTLSKTKPQNHNFSKNPTYLSSRKKYIKILKKIFKSLSYKNITLYLALKYIDEVFAICQIKKKEENLIVFVSFCIAAKLHESKDDLINLDQAVAYLNFEYSKEQLENCEKVILKHILGFDLNLKTAYDFLVFFCFCGVVCRQDFGGVLGEEVLEVFEWVCFMLLEFCLEIYECYSRGPGFVAASCVFAARKIFGFEVWGQDLEVLSGFGYEELKKNSKLLIKTISIENSYFLSKIFKKVSILKSNIGVLLKKSKIVKNSSLYHQNENQNNLNKNLKTKNDSFIKNFDSKINLNIHKSNNVKNNSLSNQESNVENSNDLKINSTFAETPNNQIFSEGESST